MRISRAMSARVPEPIRIEAVHASSRTENMLRNVISTMSAKPAVVSACSGLYNGQLGEHLAVVGSARHQHDEVPQPQAGSHEARVDQHVVGEEHGAAPGREIGDQGVRQGAGTKPGGSERVRNEPDGKTGQRRQTRTASHGKQHQGDQQEIGTDPRVPETGAQVELQHHQQDHDQQQLHPADAVGAHWAESLGAGAGPLDVPPWIGERAECRLEWEKAGVPP